MKNNHKKTLTISIDFNSLSKIHNHSFYLPDKGESMLKSDKDFKKLLERISPCSQKIFGIIYELSPELSIKILKDSIEQAEYEDFCENNRRSLYNSVSRCVQKMSQNKPRFMFDLNFQENIEFSPSVSFLKFNITTWDDKFDSDLFRLNIENEYKEFEAIQNAKVSPDIIVSDNVFDKVLARNLLSKPKDFYKDKIINIALSYDDERRVKAVEDYCSLIEKLTKYRMSDVKRMVYDYLLKFDEAVKNI